MHAINEALKFTHTIPKREPQQEMHMQDQLIDPSLELTPNHHALIDAPPLQLAYMHARKATDSLPRECMHALRGRRMRKEENERKSRELGVSISFELNNLRKKDVEEGNSDGGKEGKKEGKKEGSEEEKKERRKAGRKERSKERRKVED